MMISPFRFISLVLAAVLVMFGASCEKHSWEETKKLHHHGGDEHGEDHGDSHGEGDAGETGEAAHDDGGH